MTLLQPQPEQCKTCIFRSGGLHLSPERKAEIMGYLVEGRPHRCHQNEALACRGGRDLQLYVFHAMELIESPTDEALEVANNEYLEGRL